MNGLPPLPDGFQPLNQQPPLPPIPEGFQLADASAPAPDKYRQAALDDLATDKKLGISQTGLKNMILHGATMGASNDILAALDTPVQMLAHGTINPVEAFKYAKAFQNAAYDQSKAETGGLGTAAELGSGVLSGTGIANAGGSFVKAGQALLPRAAAMAGDGAAYGGVNGFFNSDDSLGGAAKGATLGAALGGALPIAGAAASTAAAPVLSNIRAVVNPGGVAESQLARAVMESGRDPGAVASEVGNAAAGGQGSYTLADALGNAGQRMLSAVTRAPGEGRTQAVEFLENRQADQSRRVGNILAEGLGAQKTAAQTASDLTSQRTADAAANYGAARGSAGAVDVSPALVKADELLAPGQSSMMNPGSSLPDDSVEGLVRRARGLLANDGEQLTGFDAAFRAKQEIDHMIERASPTQQRALIPVRNALDSQLSAASEPYANARSVFKEQSQAIDAIPQGRQAAMRGRAEDTIPAFEGMRPDQQAAFRVGYADPLIEAASNAAPGVNKARPLLGDGPQAELGAMSLHNGPYQPGAPEIMAQKLARENTMFETRNHAMGNSRTADNLADQGALEIDPSMIGHLLHGNFVGAGASALRSVGNGLTGNTENVRKEMAKLLLQRGSNPDLGAMLSRVTDSAKARQALAAALSQGAAVGSGEVSGRYLK